MCQVLRTVKLGFWGCMGLGRGVDGFVATGEEFVHGVRRDYFSGGVNPLAVPPLQFYSFTVPVNL